MKTSNKITCLIFDRDQSNIQLICKMLMEVDDEINMAAASYNLSCFESMVLDYQPDLVIIDASLIIGYDIQFSQEEFRNFDIIFTSDKPDFAIDAFKYSALYCICKPFVQTEFNVAVSRFKNKHPFHSIKEIDSLLELNNSNSYRIMLPDVFGFRLVNANEIIRCEAQSCYTNFYLEDSERIVVSKPLSSFVNLLPKQLFCRVHNKHLINMNYIKQYIKGRGGEIIFHDGSSVDVSERKKKEFLEHLKKLAYSIEDGNFFV
ncbi:LytTR family transcriptional regulator DNA-binding domain-containing protein [Marinifilum fragile]|uniref:LytR/AlgR family response regulator transcription factor n=1 Tax=Marinifilum fragile TaxID=570161 RepID=UPI002AA6739B|nr:LytTR family transcriptional regulator DNA-binding domain-containing protein [Marinifilum fragile]